jgi:hypothetical protein
MNATATANEINETILFHVEWSDEFGNHGALFDCYTTASVYARIKKTTVKEYTI